MTTAQLCSVMRYQLRHFNDEGVAISDGTVHDEVLADDDGFGAANSKAVYKAAIRWTLANNNGGDPDWPKNWMQMRVDTLAGKLLA
ncbi:MAG: hypothetical protein JWO05_3807 [Gemmatimonadetes bacterium]|nr:hypothetical protein [Gemmatimonadota bacterium]